MGSIGHVWTLWDPHVHTPASFHWQGPKLTGDAAADHQVWLAVSHALQNAAPAVYIIQDYWTFDGWLTLRQLQQDPANHWFKKKLIPGIELRVESPTSYRLNLHLVLRDTLPRDRILEIQHSLRIASPDPTKDHHPLTQENLGRSARALSDDALRTAGTSPSDRQDETKMRLVGAKTAVITRASFQDTVQAFANDVLVMMPWDTSDGLSEIKWQDHPVESLWFMRSSHIIEARKQSAIDLFLGTHDNRELQSKFTAAIRGLRPVVSGSDAHSPLKYGEFPSRRKTWMKTSDSFDGLREACLHPQNRSFVGLEPDDLVRQRERPRDHIRRVEISTSSEASTRWFDTSLDLNPGMVAIVGRKGAGKTALADILAFACGASVPNFGFLSETRFLAPRNRVDASHCKVAIRFGDGTEIVRALAPESGAAPRAERPRAIYLPQSYIEDLCSELQGHDAAGLQGFIGNVIFQHLSDAERGTSISFDEFRSRQTEEHRATIRMLRSRVEAANEKVAHTERMIETQTIASLRAELTARQADLAALKAAEPVIPESSESSEELRLLAAIDQSISDGQLVDAHLEQQRVRKATAYRILRTFLARAKAIEKEVDALFSSVRSVDEDAASKLSQAFVIRLSVDSMDTLIDALREEAVSIEHELEDISTNLESLKSERASLLSRMREPVRLREEALRRHQAWEDRCRQIRGDANTPGSIEWLEARLELSDGSAGRAQLDAVVQERDLAAIDLLSAIVEEVTVLSKAYSRLESTVAEDQVLSRMGISFAAEMTVDTSAIDALTLKFDRRHRTTDAGWGSEISATIRHLSEVLLADTPEESIRSLKVLESRSRSVNGERVEWSDYERLLKTNDGFLEVLNFIYGFEWVSNHYGLEMSGKRIELLSPGERGVLLLVFALLVDHSGLPVIVDQPEHNLDNDAIFTVLGAALRCARKSRQVILVTHNPNLAVALDAEQILLASYDIQRSPVFEYASGTVADPHVGVPAVNTLEGSLEAFGVRRDLYDVVFSRRS